jgi:hypothetical protein
MRVGWNPTSPRGKYGVMLGLKRRSDAKAFSDLMSLLKSYENKFRWRRLLTRDNEFAEGYSAMLDLLAVGLDCYIHNSPDAPRFVRLVSPIRKIGGDNADALYYFAPLNPGARYRIEGTMGSAAYLAFTTYGGDTPKEFHIVANTSTPDVTINDDGTFEIEIAPNASGANTLRTDETTNCVIVRRYYLDKDAMESDPGAESIEPHRPPSVPPLLTGEEMGKRIRQLEQFLRGWFKITPIPLPPIPPAYNKMTPPRQASADSGHWSTPDNIHSFGFFKLAEDEGLVIKGRSPECLYWSVHLWNPYLQTYDYANYPCALSSSEVELAQDGSWELLVSHRDPGHPNWISTTGHPRGFVYFRWLKSASVPEKLRTSVRKI